jgi:hypothetical protein
MEIVMLFLRAKVIPVIPQIHGNVMCPLFVLNFIFEPLFVHAPDIIVFFNIFDLIITISAFCSTTDDAIWIIRLFGKPLK